MLFWIIVGVVVCMAFGLPALPVLILGAASMCGMAYAFTRSKNVLRSGIALGILTASYLINTATGGERPDGMPDFLFSLVQSPTPVIVGAIFVMLYSAVVGIFGPLEDKPDSLKSVVEAIEAKQREDKQRL